METFESENLLSDEKRSYQVVGQNTPNKYWIGLIIILLSNISLSIVSVSIWPYLHYNNLSIYVFAISISGFHTGASIGRKFFSYYIEKTQSYWLLLFTSLAVTFIGDILYAAIPDSTFVLISRAIVGFGTGSQVILQSLLTDSSDPILLKTRISKVSLATSFGYIIGPAIIAIISSINLTTALNIKDGLLVLVWLSAFLTFLAMVIAIIGKFTDNSISRHYQSNLGTSGEIDEGSYQVYNKNIFRAPKACCIIPPKVLVVIFGFTHFLIFNAGMVLETLIIPFLTDVGGVSSYNWNLTKISLFFMGLGVSCAITLFVSKKITDQSLLLIGSVMLMVVGYGFMIVWSLPDSKIVTNVENLDPPLVRFLLGVVSVAIGFPLAVTSSITLFFQLFSGQSSSFYSTFFQFASNFGRLLGPVWAALIFSYVNSNFTFLFAFILCLVSLFFLIITKKSIRYINTTTSPKKNPIISINDEDDNNQF
ncbi:hypothetical protein DICPUDRAFT_94789 [Dictyostelium purpureum]|uniref:Major facilitator superfamily (MFS) profile domain-containing protein n=1 Tax=Dictyostelium purpureum TaxID=5786 RepID=F0ZNI2_DICPU|nr:uncharacterized protein DICPUDRAFT_94789 [Dictyostelium purpureum]EGC34502.1 hypothetical protein DICPUDRAFT_94789 [Dictyostelium purpureum]|eukprot:XP_003288991.1 hypothetical protein DICPUDRAFT_94789 [Dictyostelium purpureum]